MVFSACSRARSDAARHTRCCAATRRRPDHDHPPGPTPPQTHHTVAQLYGEPDDASWVAVQYKPTARVGSPVGVDAGPHPVQLALPDRTVRPFAGRGRADAHQVTPSTSRRRGQPLSTMVSPPGCRGRRATVGRCPAGLRAARHVGQPTTGPARAAGPGAGGRRGSRQRHRCSRARSRRSRQPPPDGGYGRPPEQSQHRAEHEAPHRPITRPVVAPHDAPSCPDPALAEAAASAASPQVVGSTHSIQVRLIVHPRHWPSR